MAESRWLTAGGREQVAEGRAAENRVGLKVSLMCWTIAPTFHGSAKLAELNSEKRQVRLCIFSSLRMISSDDHNT